MITNDVLVGSTSCESVFTKIYTTNGWGCTETVSGEGSEREQTKAIREKLPKLFKLWGVNTIVDAPCGDYHWFQECPVSLESYIGVDVVQPLIDSNIAKYADERHTFMKMDLCTQIVPKADLIMCRDCLIHLSHEDTFKVLRNFKRSGCKYLLVTTNPDNPHNKDINVGEFRHLNMQKPPFNFPAPITLVNEDFQKYGGMFSDKSLGLWLLGDLSL